MKTTFLIFLVFYLTSCDGLGDRTSANNTADTSIEINRIYSLVNDISSEFAIRFMGDSAFPLTFADSSAKTEFIDASQKYISKPILVRLLNKKAKPLGWDAQHLTNITLTNYDSLLKRNLAQKEKNYFSYLSTPLFDEKGEYAIIKIFRNLPDESIAYGGGCIYIFRHIDSKWTEIARENCVDY